MWIKQIPLQFVGIQMGSRMTVVKLSSGFLWVHSPVSLDEETKEAIKKLGTVQHIVSPNLLHHLYMSDWQKEFPNAQLHASPNLEPRRPDIAASSEAVAANADWGDDIDQVVLGGHAFHEEVIFFHKQSHTLIVSDYIENFGYEESSWQVTLMAQSFGMREQPGPPTDMKLTWVDRDVAYKAVKKILSWDFDKIILAHGRMIEYPMDAKEVFRDAWAWVFPLGYNEDNSC